MEPKGKAKADVSARMALTEAVMLRDWALAFDTFQKYGTYLLLIGQDTQVGEPRVFTYTRVR